MSNNFFDIEMLERQDLKLDNFFISLPDKKVYFINNNKYNGLSKIGEVQKGLYSLKINEKVSNLLKDFLENEGEPLYIVNEKNVEIKDKFQFGLTMEGNLVKFDVGKDVIEETEMTPDMFFSKKPVSSDYQNVNFQDYKSMLNNLATENLRGGNIALEYLIQNKKDGYFYFVGVGGIKKEVSPSQSLKFLEKSDSVVKLDDNEFIHIYKSPNILYAEELDKWYESQDINIGSFLNDGNDLSILIDKADRLPNYKKALLNESLSFLEKKNFEEKNIQSNNILNSNLLNEKLKVVTAFTNSESATIKKHLETFGYVEINDGEFLKIDNKSEIKNNQDKNIINEVDYKIKNLSNFNNDLIFNQNVKENIMGEVIKKIDSEPKAFLKHPFFAKFLSSQNIKKDDPEIIIDNTMDFFHCANAILKNKSNKEKLLLSKMALDTANSLIINFNKNNALDSLNNKETQDLVDNYGKFLLSTITSHTSEELENSQSIAFSHFTTLVKNCINKNKINDDVKNNKTINAISNTFGIQSSFFLKEGRDTKYSSGVLFNKEVANLKTKQYQKDIFAYALSNPSLLYSLNKSSKEKFLYIKVPNHILKEAEDSPYKEEPFIYAVFNKGLSLWDMKFYNKETLLSDIVAPSVSSIEFSLLPDEVKIGEDRESLIIDNKSIDFSDEKMIILDTGVTKDGQQDALVQYIGNEDSIVPFIDTNESVIHIVFDDNGKIDTAKNYSVGILNALVDLEGRYKNTILDLKFKNDTYDKDRLITMSSNIGLLISVSKELISNKLAVKGEDVNDNIDITISSMFEKIKTLYENQITSKINQSEKEQITSILSQPEKDLITNKKLDGIVAYSLGDLTKNYSFDHLTKEEFIKKIASQLARSNSFLGSVNYSTLQHSINVAKIAMYNEQKEKGILNDNDKFNIVMASLFHDASEVIAMNDLPTPLKNEIPQYKEIENEILNNVFKKLDLEGNEYAIMNKYKIDIADKKERSTFIDLHIKSENNLEQAIYTHIYNEYLSGQINKTDTLLGEDDLKKMIANTNALEKALKILDGYLIYTKAENKSQDLSDMGINKEAQKFIESYKLNNVGVEPLTKEEVTNIGLEMGTVYPEALFSELSGLLKSVNVNISASDFLQEYNKNNYLKADLEKLDGNIDNKIAENLLKRLQEEKIIAEKNILDNHKTQNVKNETEKVTATNKIKI